MEGGGDPRCCCRTTAWMYLLLTIGKSRGSLKMLLCNHQTVRRCLDAFLFYFFSSSSLKNPRDHNGFLFREHGYSVTTACSKIYSSPPSWILNVDIHNVSVSAFSGLLMVATECCATGCLCGFGQNGKRGV